MFINIFIFNKFVKILSDKEEKMIISQKTSHKEHKEHKEEKKGLLYVSCACYLHDMITDKNIILINFMLFYKKNIS